MKPILKSSKLTNVCYDIRGPVLDKARQMEEEGHKIIKLNIGNLAAFGLEPPDEIVQDMIRNLPHSAGYTDSKGLFAPRKAVVHYSQEKHIAGVGVDDVYLGNGASELIVMSLNALLDGGDEVLVPAPDYPLWTAAGVAVGRQAGALPLRRAGRLVPRTSTTSARKITPRTRGIVVINPNNPTGALYPPELLLQIVELARQHQLIVFADEIYDKTLYDGHTHTSIASLADDVLFVTFNGLSKNYRSCGYRAGWMIVSGDKRHARDYIEGLNMLASMRLCANTPGQLAIQTALGGYQSIKDLVAPGGRLCRQRDLAYELLTQIPGVSVVKPKAALYMFPRLDPKMYPIADDQQFAYELLAEEKVLIVQGTGFNWPAYRPLPARLPAEFRRPERGHRPHRALPRPLPQTPLPVNTMQPIQVGLLGIGTVGSGTFNVLQRNQAEIRRRAGRGIEITMVADLDVERARSVVGPEVAVVSDARQVIANPDIDIVIELIGGYGIARTLVLEAIAAGKHVVTANKALLAVHGTEIFAAASAKGVVVAFEAAVAGGIPIIKALREGLSANRIDWIAGIINGTTNFILSEMRSKGLDFDAALKDAQALGYAEADPTFDIEGIDAAHKATIMSALAFGVPVQFDKAHVEGITQLQAADIRYAEQLGYRIKLLGITKRREHGIELRVHPTLIPSNRLIANVEGAMNAVVVQGDAVGTTLYYGKGAGAEPTASAVVADLVDITRLHTADPDHRVPHLAFQRSAMQDTPILPIDEVVTAFYLRLQVADEKGVLARITGILADNDISIDAVLQRESAEGERQTDLIILTHDTVEGRMKKALAQMQALPTVLAPIVRIRKEELN